MGKIQRPVHIFDEELKEKGMRRISIAEIIQMSDGYLATAYREKIIKESEYQKTSKKPWWKNVRKTKK